MGGWRLFSHLSILGWRRARAATTRPLKTAEPDQAARAILRAIAGDAEAVLRGLQACPGSHGIG